MERVADRFLLLFALATSTLAAPRGLTAAEEKTGMVLVPARWIVVGTSNAQRQDLAKRFDCHPTWLNDDLTAHDAVVGAFWIDRFPVTNARYLAFVEATGRPRPSWWNRWGGVFPREYAEHPAVGLGAQDAVAYARWAGKRLPTAEEWEAAVADPDHGLFAWGNAWPGPLKLQQPARLSWELPGTRAVGGGDCGRSAAGVEDFAGQVLEWVADVIPHHGSQFRRLKGASWFHEDPLSFRVAAGCCALENWQSGFTGLRCARRQRIAAFAATVPAHTGRIGKRRCGPTQFPCSGGADMAGSAGRRRAGCRFTCPNLATKPFTSWHRRPFSGTEPACSRGVTSPI